MGGPDEFAAEMGKQPLQLPKFNLPDPKPPLPPYYVMGATPDQEKHIRDLALIMGSKQYPDLVAIPSQKFSFMKKQTAMGGTGFPQRVSEGRTWAQTGKAFTIPGVNRVWFDAALLGDDDGFVRDISHELGHKEADTDTSEAAADRNAKVMRQRYKDYRTQQKPQR